MNKEEFEAYLNNRYYDQINWYDKKAMFNQRIYETFQRILIVLSALTPILVGIEDSIWQGRWLAIAVSFAVAVATSALTTFKYHEKWINYRTTCETLRKEIHFYNAKIREYADSEDPEGLFIERVESLISRENTLWLVSEKIKEKH